MVVKNDRDESHGTNRKRIALKANPICVHLPQDFKIKLAVHYRNIPQLAKQKKRIHPKNPDPSIQWLF